MINFRPFVENDPRKDRTLFTVTEESLYNRCEVMLPKNIIQGKSVLDIGCAAGAMGHWCLENSASLYHGVEVQKSYIETAEELLSVYQNSKIFDNIEDTNDSYDVVIAAGVLHGSFDIINKIKQLCIKSTEYVIIESHLITESESPSIQITTGNMINHSDVNNPFSGLQLSPTISALNLLMQTNGFEMQGRLFPRPIKNSHDAYDVANGNLHRFIARYKRTNNYLLTLEESINVGV